MQSLALRRRSLAQFIALAATVVAAPCAQAMDYLDHYEFDAALSAPYRAAADHSRTFDLRFRFPGADDGTTVAWRLDITDSDGVIVRRLRGESTLGDGEGSAQVRWSERDPQNGPLAFGFYKVHLRAHALNPLTDSALAFGPLDQRVDNALRFAEDDDQVFDIQVGNVARPAMPAFAALPTGADARMQSKHLVATGGLPYTVYLGNLHSQTNLSDGGGDLSTCISEQSPQSGAGSPTNAYQYALNEGLDFLMTSEHNHMFDGSTSTNASASPTTAKNLYQSGQTMRDSFNTAHPSFLALAGLEWGVISNGGHMNIFNTPKLLEWEYNSSNQLIGDIFTAKGDYGALYTLMKTNGWIGQFNHPASTGQFNIGGTDLAYTADGDQAMVLCEVMNSSAFSHNTTETEASHSSYEGACNKLLEAGYHVAFSSDQDNHCANWGGSYTNRTGVLIPNGAALNQANFIAALKARHVYATYDKTSQIVLTTSGGHIMGDQFSNSGSLTLTVNYAPGAGRSASQVQIMQGVPGSNGTVAVLSTSSSVTTTPSTGAHFYYAKVTQDNGTLLFSAPVWVNEGTGGGGGTPTANFSFATSGLTATFTDTSTDSGGTISAHAWIFGDGATSTATSPSHTYAAAGTYSVSETVTDSVNGNTSSKTASVTVATSGGTPTANFSFTTNGLTAAFTDSSTDSGGTISAHAWTFGDGATSTATSPSHTYAASGTYSVSEKVTDSVNGTTNTKTASVTVSGGITPVELVKNGGFESGATSWTASSGVITNTSGESAHAGSYFAWLDGYGTATTDTVTQSVAIPSTATSATLSFWLHIDTAEATTVTQYDKLTVQIQNSSGTVLATLATYSNLNANTGYAQKTFDVTAYKGQTVKIYFKGVEDAQDATSFVIDDVSLKYQ
jgi:PKD repeat protein